MTTSHIKQGATLNLQYINYIDMYKTRLLYCYFRIFM